MERQNVLSVFLLDNPVEKRSCNENNLVKIKIKTSQLLRDVSGTEITENLKPFRIYRQDHQTDKYSSMAICVKGTLEVREYEYIPSLNALKFNLLDIKLQESLVFLLVYRTILISHNIWKHYNVS